MGYQIETLEAYFTGDTASLEIAGKKAISIADAVEARFKNLKTSINITTNKSGSGTGGADAAMKQAIADINRYKAESIKAEKEITRSVESEAKQQASIRIREMKRATDEFARETGKSASAAKEIYSSSLGGSFFGNLGANAVSYFASKFAELPGLVSDQIGKAVDLSEKKLNALKGLDAAASFKGIDEATTQSALQNLRLVKSGIIDISDASVGLKNLLLTNFTLDESIQLLEAFSDNAAFGKQAALSYGEAVRSATEGLKQGNSILLDNSGLTKNLSVILQEQGKTQQDVMNITSDASVRQAAFNGLMKESLPVVGNADLLVKGYTGSVAGLEQAYKLLYTAGGDLITQSPELIAANKVQADQVRLLTEDLTKQGSETSELVRDWVVMYAQIKAVSLPFAATIKNIFAGIFASASGLAAGSLGVMSAAVESVLGSIKFTVGTIFNFVTNAYNKILDLANQIPSPVLATAGLGFLQNLPRATSQIDTSFDFSSAKKLFNGAQEAFKASQNYADKTKKSLDEIGAALGDVDTYARAFREDLKQPKEAPKTNSQGSDSDSPASKKKKKGPKSDYERVQDSYLNDVQLRKIAEDLGLTVTATTGGKHNKGSRHPLHLAVDARTKDKTPAQLEYIRGELQKKGVYVSDERQRPKNQKVWDGPHFHLEDARLHGGRTQKNDDGFEKFLANKSDELTKAEQEKVIRRSMDLFKAVGLVPTGEMLDRFQSLMADEAKKAGVIQPSKDDVRQIFEKNAQEKRPLQPIEEQPVQLSTVVSNRKTLDEDYISSLSESARLIEGRNGEESRYTALILRERNLMEEVSITLEDQSLSRREATVEAQKEYQVLLRRNILDEASVAFTQSRNDQLRQTGDVERDLLILQQQNADANFVKERRMLALKNDQFSLEQQITSLKDQISNSGRNTALEIEAANLRDILALRDLETQKIIEGNRSLSYRLQVQLAQIPSNKQIGKDFLANLPEGVSNILDTIRGEWDGTWSGLFESVKKGFAQMLSDLAAQYLKAAVSRLIGQLVGSLIGALGGGFASAGGLAPASGSSFAPPGRASGGPVEAGKLHMVGERGPELYVPNVSGQILNNNDTKEILSGKRNGGQTIINNTVNQTIKAPRGLIAAKSASQAADHALNSMARNTR